MKYIPKELKDNVNVSPISHFKEFLILLCGLFGIFLIIYIILGFTVNIIIPWLPFKIEKTIGEFYSKTYPDTKKTKDEIYLQKILFELVKNFPDKNLSYKIHITPNANANAISLPGNNIIVFSGLLKEVTSENEIAFILSHELGHFANKDHLHGIGKGLVLLIMSITLLGADNSITEFLEKSFLTVNMKFSQEQEKLADKFALELLNKRYGHVGGATDFFKRINKKEKASKFTYFLSTHPHPQSRIKYLQELIKTQKYLIKEKKPVNTKLLNK